MRGSAAAGGPGNAAENGDVGVSKGEFERPFAREEDMMENGRNHQDADGAQTVSWTDLPRKDQLFVITMTRLSEPLVQTSIQSYMFYQLKWFDPTLPDSVISGQAGVLQCVLPGPPA